MYYYNRFNQSTKRNKFTPVETVLNVEDDRLWFYIPGFNGYEVSNDGFIRSMKHYRRYPFGLLIQPKKDRAGNIISPEDPTYELSTNNNERVAIKLSQLLYLAKTNPYGVTGFPRSTCITDTNPRNQRYFVKKQIKTLPEFNKEPFYPKFSIVKEEENQFMEKRRPDIVCPIESINGGETYGRKDSRAFIYLDV